MKNFFEPRSVAVIGASNNEHKDGYKILKNIVDCEFKGDIYPVNKSADEILGLKAYPKIQDVPGDVDLAVIIIPAKFCAGAVEDCAEKGVKAVIIEAMGFNEVGAGGTELQNQIVKVAKEHNIRVMGPNCTGIVSRDMITTFFPIKDIKPNGNVTMIGQSGLLAAGMASDIIKNDTLKINKICSIGNKCDINENDLLNYFKDDDQTDVVSMYLESIAEGKELVKVGKEITAKKPVILLYGGRTEAGAAASKSHTGSIASNSRIVDAAIRQAKFIKAEDFAELKDYAKLMSTMPVPKGNKVAVVTAAGSVGVVVSDLCEENGLKLPKLGPQTVEALKDVFPEFMPPANPIDLWFSIEKYGLAKTLEVTMSAPLNDPDIDAVILILAGFDYTLEVIEKKVVQGIAAKHNKPIIVCMLVGYNEIKNMILEGLGKDIPVFTSLAGGVKALSKYCDYGMKVHKGK